MPDYSISAKLKVDSTDLVRVRKELTGISREFAAAAEAIKKGFGGALGGIAAGMRGAQAASRTAARSVESDWNRANAAWVRNLRQYETSVRVRARSHSGNARQSVKEMLAAERIIDAQIKDLAHPRKQETADSVAGRYNANGDSDGGFSVFGGNLAAGVVLRVFDFATDAVGRFASGMVDATRQMMETQRELQLSRVGIASLYVAGGQDIGGAMGKSADTMRVLRRQAAEGVGGLSDYTKAYQTLQSPMMLNGRSEAELRKLVRLTIAAGGAMEGRLGIRTAPVDVLQALGRGATDAQTRILSSVIRKGGKSLEEFNAMDQGKKIDFLMTALEKWEPAAKMMGKTMDSMEETIKDWRENVFGVALSARTADRYSQSLGHQIRLMTDNEAALTRYNEILGISFGVLADFKISMTEARAEADAATASSKASQHQALRAAGGLEMMSKYMGDGASLKNFYVGLDYAGNALISFGSRLVATMALPNSGRFAGDPVGLIKALAEIWTHQPQDPLQGNDIWSGKARNPGAYTKEMLHPDKLGAGIAKGMQQHARRDRLDFHARIDWGNPRSIALSVERMLSEVAQRAYAVRVSSDALPAFPR